MATRSFDFEAYGETEAEAVKALKRGLSEHTKQFKLTRGWYAQDDIQTMWVTLGVSYRDRQPIKGADHAQG
jgi:hypothetical protein